MQARDRFLTGFVAGFIAGIPMNIVSYIMFKLNIAHITFVDWAGIVIYGNRPQELSTTIFALLVQLIFAGMLGVIFAYLVAGIFNSKNYLFKGWVFAFASWFIIYSLAVIMKISQVTQIPLGTAITDFAGATVYGLTLAETLHRMDLITGL